MTSLLSEIWTRKLPNAKHECSPPNSEIQWQITEELHQSKLKEYKESNWREEDKEDFHRHCTLNQKETQNLEAK
jgi:hypothetical protein